MDSPRKSKSEDLEVTGVSRSGRVRKKSSKLMDFESLDEIDIRVNRKKEKTDFNMTVGNKKKNSLYSNKHGDLMMDDEMDGGGGGGNYSVKTDEDDDDDDDDEEAMSDESEQELRFPQNEDSSFDSFGSEDGEGDMEDSEGFQAIAGDSADELSQQQSIYMIERSNKKKLVIKDGKIIGRMKAQRKDANNWRKKGARSKSKLDSGERKGGKGGGSSPHRKFSNMGGRQQTTPSSQPQFESNRAASKVNLLMDINSSVFKQVATAPLDVAAHLKLLGESLTIIGERLTEHEGQIAVSGSFSLLLDSLLCALVPLMCLTQQVPQLNCIPQDILSQAMDNIAYIMPGL